PKDVRIIIFDQLPQLRNRLFIHVLTDLGQQLRTGIPPVASAVQTAIATWIVVIPIIAGSVGIAPIEGMGVVEAEFKAVLLTGDFQVFHWAALERRGLDNVIIADLRVIHSEAIMILGS